MAASEQSRDSLPAKPGKESELRRRELAKDKAGKSEVKKQQMEEDFLEDTTLRVRELYRELGPTLEWAENNYYHLPIEQQNADLITVNAFWKDFADHDPATPFISRNLAEATGNFPEMLLALAVLDFPFESPVHTTEFEGTRMNLMVNTVVVFHEEIKRSEAADGELAYVTERSDE